MCLLSSITKSSVSLKVTLTLNALPYRDPPFSGREIRFGSGDKVINIRANKQPGPLIFPQCRNCVRSLNPGIMRILDLFQEPMELPSFSISGNLFRHFYKLVHRCFQPLPRVWLRIQWCVDFRLCATVHALSFTGLPHQSTVPIWSTRYHHKNVGQSKSDPRTSPSCWLPPFHATLVNNNNDLARTINCTINCLLVKPATKLLAVSQIPKTMIVVTVKGKYNHCHEIIAII